jgi:hypothetical protein
VRPSAEVPPFVPYVIESDDLATGSDAFQDLQLKGLLGSRDAIPNRTMPTCKGVRNDFHKFETGKQFISPRLVEADFFSAEGQVPGHDRSHLRTDTHQILVRERRSVWEEEVIEKPATNNLASVLAIKCFESV